MDNQTFEERFEAILSAIQILSPVKSAITNHMANSERLARNYIIKKVLDKLEKEKKEIILIQSNKKKQLADEVIRKLDEYIVSLSNTREMKSYVGYVILEDYLGRKSLPMEEKSETETPSTDNNDNGNIQPEENHDENDKIAIEPLSDLEDELNENVIDSDSEKIGKETIDEPIFDRNARIRGKIYSDDEEEISAILACYYTFLLNKRHPEAEVIKDNLIEIFQFYNLDIKESFSNVATKEELFDAYENFRRYTAINFLSAQHKEEMLNAFKCYIYYLLEID